MILAAIAEHRARRALLWARVKNYQDVLDIAKILPHPENSTGRQIAAFYHKHLQTLDEAGVSPEQVARVASREDKLISTTARAISRVEKCLPEDRAQQVQEIMNDAELLPANELARKWLNGHDQIPMEWITLADGTPVLVVICKGEDDAARLAQRIGNLAGTWGDELPALVWACERWKRAAD
jgi:hypothetical protein